MVMRPAAGAATDSGSPHLYAVRLAVGLLQGCSRARGDEALEGTVGGKGSRIAVGVEVRVEVEVGYEG